MFRKVLIANRGEIAVRVIRTLREMGIATVAVYSDADRASLHVRMADEAEHVGPVALGRKLSAHRQDPRRRPQARRRSHPPGLRLPQRERRVRGRLRGRRHRVHRTLGRLHPRAWARRPPRARRPSRPARPWCPGIDHGVTLEEARAVRRALTAIPILLKAVAGGGGKGMRRVDREADLEAAFRDAASEAERAFRSAEIYVEKLIERPRHIEIQVLGDRHGNMVHLGERECSIQRRHQKVIEECPSPLVARASRDAPRDGRGGHPRRARRGLLQRRHGRVPGGPGPPLLLPRNEHAPAGGASRSPNWSPASTWCACRSRSPPARGCRSTQDDVAWRGSAIECRIYAEDPYNNFLPYPGKLTRLTRPLGPGIRLDGCVYEGWTVPMEYDPLLAKLAVWAGTRDEAVDAHAARAPRIRRRAASAPTSASSARSWRIPNSAPAHLHTGFIDEFFARHHAPKPPAELTDRRGAGGRAPRIEAHSVRSVRVRRAAEPLAGDRKERAAAMKLVADDRRRRRRDRHPRARAGLPLPTRRRRRTSRRCRNRRARRLLRPDRRPQLRSARRGDALGAGRGRSTATASKSRSAIRAASAASGGRAGADGVQTVAAPMPGKVVRVLAAVGRCGRGRAGTRSSWKR